MNKIFNLDKAEWTISGAFAYDEYLLTFIDITNKLSNNNSQIKSVFGSPAGLVWNGGRFLNHKNVADNVKSVITSFNEKGVCVNITANSMFVTEADLDDKMANNLLTTLVSTGKNFNLKNGIIVSSDKLLDYVKNNYPELDVTISLIKVSFEANREEYYKHTINKADQLLLHPDDNFNWDLISTLPVDRVEVLVNEQCIANCKFRAEHYNKLDLANRHLDKKKELISFFEEVCISGSTIHKYPDKRIISYTQDELKTINQLGVYKFKIQGRRNASYSFLNQMFGMCTYIFDNDFYSNIAFRLMVASGINEL